MSYSSTVLADSPLGYWRLGDSSGTTMVDSSGNSHNGSYSSVTLGATGALVGDADTAVTFNGSSSHGDVSNGGWQDVTTALSVEAWIKTSATGFRSFVDRDGGGADRCFQFRQNGGSLEFVKILSGVTTASQATSINDGAWHHVVATYDGSNIRLYKDGSLINTTPASGSLAASGTTSISIGANDSAGYSQFWNGQIDEVAYYNTVLTLTRISAHYAAGTATAPPTGAGSLTLSGSGAAAAAATGSGSISLAGSGAAKAPAVGAASLALSGAGAVGSQAATGSGALSLSGSGSATLADSGTGFLVLSATAAAEALYVTDTSNLLNGRNRRARATSTVTRPAAVAPSRAAVKYDKSVPYPPPTLVNGRPT